MKKAIKHTSAAMARPRSFERWPPSQGSDSGLSEDRRRTPELVNGVVPVARLVREQLLRAEGDHEQVALREQAARGRASPQTRSAMSMGMSTNCVW